MTSLVIFDLDGTLAESKAAIDSEMGGLLAALVRVVPVAIISGADMTQFREQLLARLPAGTQLERLSLLPTCGTRFYRFAESWQELYAEDLSAPQKEKISRALEAAVSAAGLQPEKTWGDLIQDRMSQITYSALGQQAPLAEKQHWDPDFEKRKRILALLEPALPEFTVRLGGSTSIDVTLPGIDKAYGIRKLRDVLAIETGAMLYVGDALFPGGNDAPARTTGAACVQVRDPNETKRVIETVIACLGHV